LKVKVKAEGEGLDHRFAVTSAYFFHQSEMPTVPHEAPDVKRLRKL